MKGAALHLKRKNFHLRCISVFPGKGKNLVAKKKVSGFRKKTVFSSKNIRAEFLFIAGRPPGRFRVQ